MPCPPVGSTEDATVAISVRRAVQDNAKQLSLLFPVPSKEYIHANVRFKYIVVQTTPPGIHHLKWGLYLIYALLNVAFVPLIWFFLVETKGRSKRSITVRRTSELVKLILISRSRRYRSLVSKQPGLARPQGRSLHGLLDRRLPPCPEWTQA